MHTPHTYRPDIDGLRAISVIPVLLFHAFPRILPFGFLGVDVFFVISGFLITCVLLREIEEGRFSIGKFYVRRVRRIFPALITVLVSTMTAGWFLLRAVEFQQLSKHVLAGATFTSNLILYRESGYFDNISESKPLLHLWSLGIEEQFYIFLPLLIFAVVKFLPRPALLKIVLVLSGISIVYSVLLSNENPSLAFYSPFARFWQLLVGSILAIAVVTKPKINLSQRFPNLLGFVGIALLMCGFGFGSVFSLSNLYLNILVTLGAVFLLISRESNFNKHVLSNRLLVRIGLISYPLYLWHWPILSMARIVAGKTPTIETRVLCLCASLVLAQLTYRFIERPIGLIRANRAIMLSLTTGMATLAISGLVIFAADGVPARSINNQQIKYSGDIGHVEFHSYIANTYFPCTPRSVFDNALTWDGVVRCNQSKKDQPIDLILLGDSHAEHLFIGLAESLPNRNIGFYIMGWSPVRSVPEFEVLYSEVMNNSHIQTVIFAAYWSAHGLPVNEMVSMVKELQEAGKIVYITDDTPKFIFDPRLCKFEGECSQDKKIFDDSYATYSINLELILRKASPLKLIPTSKFLCAQKTCSMTDGRHLLYRDFDHLNINGSRLVGERITDFAPELGDDTP